MGLAGKYLNLEAYSWSCSNSFKGNILVYITCWYIKTPYFVCRRRFQFVQGNILHVVMAVWMFVGICSDYTPGMDLIDNYVYAGSPILNFIPKSSFSLIRFNYIAFICH